MMFPAAPSTCLEGPRKSPGLRSPSTDSREAALLSETKCLDAQTVPRPDKHSCSRCRGGGVPRGSLDSRGCRPRGHLCRGSRVLVTSRNPRPGTGPRGGHGAA